MKRKLIIILTMPLPWAIKRWLLCKLLGFQIHPTARIGLSWLGMKQLVMEEGTRIGHGNVFKGLDLVKMEGFSAIGRFNLFTCIATSNRKHFQHVQNRKTTFHLGIHARVTMLHLLDCNAPITVGRYSTLAGYQSQFLTHSIDVVKSRQDVSPISIGDYCFLGTRCLLLGGTTIPDRSVLGAGAIALDNFTEAGGIYAGVPAKWKKALPHETAYWLRTDGFIN